MIKAGEMFIESTDVEWGFEYENLTWGGEKTVVCDNEEDARWHANCLNGKVVRRTVLMTKWEEA